MNHQTPESARKASGLSLDQMAAKVRLHPRYLRDMEKHGCRSYGRAVRLARLYGCPIDAFRVRRVVKGTDPQGQHPTPFAATGADTLTSAGRSSFSSRRYRKPATPILTLEK